MTNQIRSTVINTSVISFLLLFVCASSFAQGNLSRSRNRIKPVYSTMEGKSDIGINVGLTTFLGDLGGTGGAGEPFAKDFNGKTLRPHLGVSYGYYPKSWFKVLGTLNFTTITGADSLITERTGHAAGRYDRNLSFRSRIVELSATAELYPIQLINKEHRETKLKPFIGTGIGVFHFNPKAKLNGDWVKLQPLRLEGQGFAEYPDSKEYKLTQLYIPFTFGLKYRLNDEFALSLSATFRQTFTDYLDDVSQAQYVDPNLFNVYLSPSDAALAQQLYYRGRTTPTPLPGNFRTDSERKDSYTSVFFTLSYNLNHNDDRNAPLNVRKLLKRKNNQVATAF